MSKSLSFFLILLLLCVRLSASSRPTPLIHDAETKHEVKREGAQVEENCQGIGEDECLMRRTLAAHLDYIYTQRHNKP